MSTQLFLLASDHPAIQALLEGLAAQLNTGFSHSLQDVDEGALVAFDASGGLAVQRAGSKEKPIVVDFVGGKAGHRRKFGGGKGQDIAKVVGLK